MMISKTGLHAIKAMVLLAGLPEGEYLGASAAAEKIQAPPNYLGKLLQILSREGLLDAQKGNRGGFRLSRDPHTITLYQIIDPIDRVGLRRGCLWGRSECSDDNPCPVHTRWGSVRDGYMKFLMETTIGDIA